MRDSKRLYKICREFFALVAKLKNMVIVQSSHLLVRGTAFIMRNPVMGVVMQGPTNSTDDGHGGKVSNILPHVTDKPRSQRKKEKDPSDFHQQPSRVERRS